MYNLNAASGSYILARSNLTTQFVYEVVINDGATQIATVVIQNCEPTILLSWYGATIAIRGANHLMYKNNISDIIGIGRRYAIDDGVPLLYNYKTL